MSGRIVVVTTGGTIASGPDPQTGKLVPILAGHELVESVGIDGIELEVDEFSRVPSFLMYGELSLRLAKRIVGHARAPDVAGVVVTHGTDTMEETVYLVDRVLDADTPVVFTGAQIAGLLEDSDGPGNLREAIRVAAARESRGRGAMLAFAGELHAAREVRKVHPVARRAFASPGYGPIGHVDGDVVSFQRVPDRRPPLPIPDALESAVDLITLYAGADARFLRASLALGARAIVLEATGRGNANPAVVEGVRVAAARGVYVIVCSRCEAGRVAPLYGNGGGRDLAEAGALFAGDLAARKARVLAQLALATNRDLAHAIAAEA